MINDPKELVERLRSHNEAIDRELADARAVGELLKDKLSATVGDFRQVVGKQLGGEIGFFFELDRSARQVARFWSADRPPGLFAHLITVKGSCLFVNLKIPLLPIKNVRN